MLWFGQSAGTKVAMIAADKIKPNRNQPRRCFDEETLAGLAKSIRQNGILQPITVKREKNGYYELIAGERRLRAAVMAGLKKVPCIEMNIDTVQSTTFAIIENMQRQNLNCFEEAEGIRKLLDEYDLTQEDVAEKLGKSQSTIANKLRLLKLSENERIKIIEGGLTERHARALLKLEPGSREKLITLAIKRKLTVEETEELVKRISEAEQPKNAVKKPASLYIIKDIRLFENTINKAVCIMKKSGLNAIAEKNENDDYLEFRVRIPKTKADTKKIFA